MLITGMIVGIFVLGYLLIALEHPLKLDKTAPALFIGMVTWALYAIFGESITPANAEIAQSIQEHGFLHFIEHELSHHLFEISNILFFLLGAMTIVEVIDLHDGFHVITSRIKTKSKRRLMWIVCILTFFLSALLDNLTTSIVMMSLMTKLVKDKDLRLIYAGMIIISANAGGAWSPIGDITTTMLWIGGQISVIEVVKWLIIPSMVCMIVPAIILSFSKSMEGEYEAKPLITNYITTPFERTFILALAVGCLVFVPIFKTVTHLPPFMGMLFGLSILWLVTEFIHKEKDFAQKSNLSVIKALSKIDAPSVLFFLGILLAVSCLQTIGLLRGVASFLTDTIGNYDIIVMVIGVLSAIVDNVPLVAASMGMYDIADTADTMFRIDGKFWIFLAYCAGTGGSMLIIGSAAGVAVMGIEKVDFIWYLKKFGPLAFAGYIAGAITYLAMYSMFT